MENFRFVFQENMYWGSCEPCTASVFSTLVRNANVNWKINLRRAVRKAVREGQPLDEFTRISDFQRWSLERSSKPRAGEKFNTLTTAAKILQWVDMLKDSLPDFIFAVNEFGLVPRLDKNGNPRLDENGNPMLYRRRKQENIVHLSGLFMSDYDHLPFPPQGLYELTKRPDYPFLTSVFQVLATLLTSSTFKPRNSVCSTSRERLESGLLTIRV